MVWRDFVAAVEAQMREKDLDPGHVEVDELDVAGGAAMDMDDLVIRLAPRDDEPDVIELWIHDKHARAAAAPAPKSSPLKFVKRSSMAYGVQGPAEQLTVGAVVEVQKRDKSTTTVRITGIAKTLPGGQVVAAFDNHEDPWHKRTSTKRRV